MLYAFKCSVCGWRRDPEVSFCSQCGAEQAIEDRDTPIAEGTHYLEPGLTDSSRLPTWGTEAGIRLHTARLQELAIRLNDPVPGAEEVAAEARLNDQKAQAMSRSIEHRLDMVQADIMQRVQAETTIGNPSGVTGRMARGYRHWRHKR